MNYKTAYFTAENCDISEFVSLIGSVTQPGDVPLAAEIEHQVPIYDMSEHLATLADPARRRDLMAEWAHVLRFGSGIIVLRKAYQDTSAIDQATAIYEQIIADEKRSAGGGADHFAAAGANDRVWNSLQKLCEQSPQVFLHYFANAAIDAACSAWLGPNYQMTAQVNLVHPGGAAQQAHRDYHLGFQTAETSGEYPAHVHDLSPVLTLQGAIAHCDMPIESGPTKLLPFSQQFRPGYMAWRREDFRQVFEERCIQLPLAKGDALFFNPALFHAAGSNSSKDVHRMANLLQVSSAFGRAMENIDREKMCNLLFPKAKSALATGSLDQAEIECAIACCAEGYSFPTNLDNDPPVGGLAPLTQAQLFRRALAEDMTATEFTTALAALSTRQKP